MAEAASSSSKPLQKAGWENDALPVGGSRVPAGMEDHANWRDLPEQPIVPTRAEDISAEYAALEAKRNAFGDLKKLLALITPTVASIYKNSATLSNTSDESKQAMIRGLQEQEARRRDEFLVQLRAFQGNDGLRPGENEFAVSLSKIIDTIPGSDCTEQAKHVAWNDEAKKLGQGLFRQQNVFLQAMKAEKKKVQAAKGEA